MSQSLLIDGEVSAYKLRHWQFRMELSKVYEHDLGLGPFSSGPDFDLLSNFQIYPISLVNHKKGGGSQRLSVNLALKGQCWAWMFSLTLWFSDYSVT